MSWNYIVIIASLLLLAGLLWKEFRRPNRARLFWRILASMLAVAAMACMVLPISYQVTQPKHNDKDIVLLTQGFHPDSLHNFRGVQKFTTDSAVLQRKDSLFIQFIADLPYFLATNTDINQVHIFGYGLEEWELQKLDQHPVTFHPAPAPTGFKFIHWDQKINSNDPLIIQGQYNNTSEKDIKLLLTGLQTNLDSTVLARNAETSFSLNITPKHLGKAVYNLYALAGKDTLAVEKIPIVTQPQENLKILLLAAAPDFESKFLKNWLYENQYAIASRSTISKNKFSKEYLNISQVPLERITNTLLDSFDVMITDQTVLASLRNTEVKTLQEHIAQGMGLIIRASNSRGLSAFDSNFSFVQQPAQSQKSFNLKLLNSAQKAGPIEAEQALYINQNSGDQPVIKDDQDRILASSRLMGAGKVVITSLFNTYTLLLEGNKTDYANLWSLMINQAARKTFQQESWGVSPKFPAVRQPVSLMLETDAPNPEIQTDAGKVYLQQNYQLPFRWQGTYWPSRTGWQSIRQEQGSPFEFFVYDQNDWKSLQFNQKLETNLQFSTRKNNSHKKEISEEKVSIYLPKLYFYLLFLMVCTFLWWESKLL